MTDHKCAGCGLVNFAENQACRRCGAPLRAEAAAQIPPARGGRQRGFGRRVLWVFGMTAFLLVAGYASLLVTSEGLDPEQTNVEAVPYAAQAGLAVDGPVIWVIASRRASCTPNARERLRANCRKAESTSGPPLEASNLTTAKRRCISGCFSINRISG